jgi:DNA segregation ATPase FtsK/SpoIIIE-like protein
MRVRDNTLYISTKATFDERSFPKSEGFTLPRFTSVHQLEDEPSSSTEIDSSMEEDMLRRKRRSPSIAPKKVIPLQEEEEQPEMPAGRPCQGGTFMRSGRQVKAPTRKGNVYGETKAPTEIIRETAGTRSWEKKVGESSQGSQSKQKQRDPGPSSAASTPREATPEPASRQKQVVQESSKKKKEESSESFEEESEEEASDEEEEDEADAEAVASSLHDKRAKAECLASPANCAKLCREGGNDFVKFMLAQAAGSPVTSKLPSKSPKEWTFRHLNRLPLSEQEEWRHACLEEIDALNKHGVLELADLPKGRKAIKG